MNEPEAWIACQPAETEEQDAFVVLPCEQWAMLQKPSALLLFAMFVCPHHRGDESPAGGVSYSSPIEKHAWPHS